MVFLNNAHRGLMHLWGAGSSSHCVFSAHPLLPFSSVLRNFFYQKVLRLLAVSIHFSPEIPSKTEGFVRPHNHQHINLLQGAARKGA
jgi:hypothetical protein